MFLSDSIANKYYCPVEANAPDDIRVSETCKKESTRTHLEVAPGDYCGDNIHGFNATCYGNGKCVRGICEAYDPKITASCESTEHFESSTKICASGMYCNTIGMICVETKEAGQECTLRPECGYGAVCARDPKASPAEPLRCMEWGSIDNGKEIYTN